MSEVSRREFLAAAGGAALLLPAALRAEGAKRYPIAFSTLGCPKWPWSKIVSNAVKWQYTGIEMRVLQGSVNLAQRPEFSSGIAATMQSLKDHNLVITDVGASAQLHEPEGAQRRAQIDNGKEFIELAHRLGVPYVRVFGNEIVKNEPKQASVDRVIAGMRTLAEFAKGTNVAVLLESHGDYTDSPTLKQILDGVALPNAALLWDVHHTAFYSKEKPEYTYSMLGKYVRHTHLKDSKPTVHHAPHFVLTGEGTIPLLDAVKVLVSKGYQGFYSFEWEKLWHPTLQEPEVAFPQYSKVMRGYLDGVGYKPEAAASAATGLGVSQDASKIPTRARMRG